MPIPAPEARPPKSPARVSPHSARRGRRGLRARSRAPRACKHGAACACPVALHPHSCRRPGRHPYMRNAMRCHVKSRRVNVGVDGPWHSCVNVPEANLQAHVPTDEWTHAHVPVDSSIHVDLAFGQPGPIMRARRLLTTNERIPNHSAEAVGSLHTQAAWSDHNRLTQLTYALAFASGFIVPVDATRHRGHHKHRPTGSASIGFVHAHTDLPRLIISRA